MYKFGSRSKRRLAQCHPDLQRIFNEVIKKFDCTVLCGYRGKEKQDRAYHEGRSQLKYPESKHNSTPSMAIDIAPWFNKKPHVRWEDKESFYYFAGYVKGVADAMGISIRAGADWDKDSKIHDQTFFDLPHFELD